MYEAHFEDVINGMLEQHPETFDQFIVSDVTESLMDGAVVSPSDLIARNLHRGRDHGLPGYNEYRYEIYFHLLHLQMPRPPKKSLLGNSGGH